MPILTPMTELEAVNEMLMSIGQAPVNTLEVTGITDVSIAKTRLATATRNLLARGFSFNTDEGYELSPDVDGHIQVPSDTLRIKSEAANVVERRHPDKGRCLYNRDTNSFTFENPVSCEIIRAQSFEDMPQTARAYAATVAARRFQSKAIGSQILDRYEQEDEARAWVILIREERANSKANMFRNPRLAGFGQRNY